MAGSLMYLLNSEVFLFISCRPHSTDSATHRKMTLSLADRCSKTQKIRILPMAGRDPECQRTEMIKVCWLNFILECWYIKKSISQNIVHHLLLTLLSSFQLEWTGSWFPFPKHLANKCDVVRVLKQTLAWFLSQQVLRATCWLKESEPAQIISRMIKLSHPWLIWHPCQKSVEMLKN